MSWFGPVQSGPVLLSVGPVWSVLLPVGPVFLPVGPVRSNRNVYFTQSQPSGSFEPIRIFGNPQVRSGDQNPVPGAYIPVIFYE